MRGMRCAAALIGASAVAAMLVTAACDRDGARRTLDFGGQTMGSTWSVRLVAEPPGSAAEQLPEIEQAIATDLARINQLLSTWDPDSELSRFNRSTSLEPFPVAGETFEVFKRAGTLADETDGAFDITIGPLVEAWGFGARDDPDARPDETTIERLREATGMRHLELDPQGQWVRKRRADVRCDVSALVPGYAADRIAGLLAGRGFRNFLVDVGGELVTRGVNAEGVPWRVAVERPDAQTGRPIERVIPLSNLAIATSGDYRNYHESDGRRVTHILDPRTGRPVQHQLASATVIDTLGVRADALATALMVLGPEEGLALAERLNVAALLLVRRADGGFDARASSHFAAIDEEE